MEKSYLIIHQNFEPCFGNEVLMLKNKEEAREILKNHYKAKRFAELYECELIDNTGYKKIIL